MSRPILLSLVLAALTAASCQLVDYAEVTHAAVLPHIGAPPPDLVLAEPATEPATAEGENTLANDVEWRLISTETQVDATGEPFTVEAIEAYLRGRHTGLSRAEIHTLAEVVIAEAERNGLEPGLVLAVIAVESNGYHRAVSPVGALGLMQILPSTGEELAARQGVRWFGPETLFDPVVNVRLGTAYLRQLSDRYDNVHAALAAYNWGPGRIDRRLRKGNALPEIYVRSVMKAYDRVGGHLALHTSSS